MSRMDQNDRIWEGSEDEAWQPAHSFLPIAEDVIQVWRVKAASEGPFYSACRALLSREEAERLSRLRTGEARAEFVTGRGCLRALVGAALQRAPQEVLFSTGLNGKPSVKGVEFNVTHSRGLILLALSRETAVGIDVEWNKPGIEALDIAEGHFAPGEIARIASAPEGKERERVFYRCWVRKEAVTKAHGQGITLSLRDFEVDLEGAHEAQVQIPGEASSRRRSFFVRGLPVPQGFFAAVAAESPGYRLQLVDLTPHLMASDEE